MKRFSIILPVIFLSFLVISCSGSDDDETTNNPLESQLVGKWSLDGITVDGVYESADSDIDDEVIEFKSDGSFTTDGIDTGTYSVTNEILKVTEDGVVTSFTITELNSTKLTLFEQTDWDDEPGDEDVTYHFVKV